MRTTSLLNRATMLGGVPTGANNAWNAPAFALGADFVFVGRPFNYAAALAGHAGVAHAVDILSREIDSAMGLLGINTLDELGQDQLVLPPDFSMHAR